MDAILSFLKEFEITQLLPDIDTFMGRLELITRLAVLAGPLLLLCLGLWYHYRPSEQPDHPLGFLGRSVMGSTDAWKFAQRIAGMCFMILGGGLFAVMLVVSIFYGLMSALGMVTTALVCIIIELALVIAAQVFINKWVLKYYDKEGNRIQ